MVRGAPPPDCCGVAGGCTATANPNSSRAWQHWRSASQPESASTWPSARTHTRPALNLPRRLTLLTAIHDPRCVSSVPDVRPNRLSRAGCQGACASEGAGDNAETHLHACTGCKSTTPELPPRRGHECGERATHRLLLLLLLHLLQAQDFRPTKSSATEQARLRDLGGAR